MGVIYDVYKAISPNETIGDSKKVEVHPGLKMAADDLRNNFRSVASLVWLEITELTFRDKETGRIYK